MHKMIGIEIIGQNKTASVSSLYERCYCFTLLYMNWDSLISHQQFELLLMGWEDDLQYFYMFLW